MRHSRTLILGTSLATLALVFPMVPPLAEVCGNDHGPGTLLLGITEDPDPITVTGWDVIDGGVHGEPLNESGDDRGDGPPHLAFMPETSEPVVVWAFNRGTDFDVAVSTWTGTEWEPVKFLSSSLNDELDPRAFAAPDGTIHVVWWQPGMPDSLGLSTREADSDLWSAPQLIGSDGQRPSVGAFEDRVLVAFERQRVSGGVDVIVQERFAGQSPTETTVTTTTGTVELDILLHVDQGRVWMEWKQDPVRFGYSELVNGQWTAPETVPWLDPSWVGQEDARKRVRSRIFNP